MKPGKTLIICSIMLSFLFCFLLGCEGEDNVKDDHKQSEHKEHAENEKHEDGEHVDCKHDDDEHGDDEHESEIDIVLTDEMIASAGIVIKQVQTGVIKRSIKLAGEVNLNEDRVAHIVPRFPGIAKKVFKHLGEYVKEGDILAIIESNESMVNYKVRSPFSGSIIEKNVTIGEFISEETSMYVVANLYNVWVNLEVYPKDALSIHIGHEVYIEAVGGKINATGTISYISPIFSKKTRNAVARVVLLNKNNQWRPGTFVKGFIALETDKEGLLVDRDAVQIVNQQPTVFIQEDSNTFEPLNVILGESSREYIQILSGLKVGDSYVSKGAFELKAKIVTSALGSHAGHGH